MPSVTVSASFGHFPNFLEFDYCQLELCFQSASLTPMNLCIGSVLALHRSQYYKIKEEDCNVFNFHRATNCQQRPFQLYTPPLICLSNLARQWTVPLTRKIKEDSRWKQTWARHACMVPLTRKIKEDSRWKQTWAPQIWGRVLPSLAAPSRRSPSRQPPSRLPRRFEKFEKSINTKKMHPSKIRPKKPSMNPYAVKKVSHFSVPSRDVTYQTLPYDQE